MKKREHRQNTNDTNNDVLRRMMENNEPLFIDEEGKAHTQEEAEKLGITDTIWLNDRFLV